ncbi:hypothetical protein DL89DRAFT_319444 [Linderina pennispora]|uniref:Nuclear condensin complex subunit 3 C-terminal domain-containing protein n=1 Tax=Linderina pennispora TaxID=61395 RepID=A0A1Y1WJI1_9FUNG|nr:uncharacterized protein DL89DRAFT_319444 [Linderina pennispora]ORX73699.1 hypothetical protein DL89DRAFT_319444 [Linderina pennispora]
MPKRTQQPSADTISSLRSVIPGIFDAAQRNSTGLRKHAVSLRKLQVQCHEFDKAELTGEAAFNKEIIRNLNKMLAVKKREPSADRVVKLLATFVQVSYEKDQQAAAKEKAQKDKDDVFGGDDDDEDEDSVSSRFVELLIRYLLQGFQAKEKMTRLRCCQIVAMSVTCLGEIDEELYFDLIKKLSERIRDKEAGIRVHAAIALSKLQSGEDAEGGEVTDSLLNLMQHDPNAEVRRAVLLNIEKNTATLPLVLERARDVDATNRKCLFLKVMPIEDRERLLTAGVNDRDANVKRACVRMIGESWLTYADQNLLELTAALDVVDSPNAAKVMQALFTAYPEIPENLQFDEELWNNLSPEMAFVIRSTLEFFNERKDTDRMDQHLPEAMKLAQLMEVFGAKLEAATDDESRPDIEFVIHQLLLIAKMSDFPDELGRREMLTLMRKMLLVPEIPENNIEAIADIIRKLSINEQDFIRIMVEVVSDVRELGAANEPEDAENARLEALLVSIKCLIIIKYILQRCFDALSEGSSMYGLLTECVVPAVQSSESVLQEYGIECLALCCLLDKNMAVDNIGLFAQAVRQGAGELHTKGLAAMLDLSFLYGVRELAPSVGSVEEFMEVLYLELESESLAVQATVAEGIARLLYARRIPEPAAVLEELLVLYYHPSTVNNYRLRQCLTYFFPAYSYITPENQQQMRDVAIEAICRLSNLLKQTATADAQSTATPGQVVQQLVAWTDPRIFEAIYAMNNNAPIRSTTRMDGFVKLGIDALKRTFRAPHNTRKVLVQMLNKLGLDDATPMIQTQELFVLARALADKQLITDMITKNALHRFETLLLKLLDVDKVEDATMEAWREEPEMASVFEFLAVVETESPEQHNFDIDGVSASDSESDEDAPVPPRTPVTRRAAALSMIDDGTPSYHSPMKLAKEARIEEITRDLDNLLSASSEDEDDESDEDVYQE